MTTEREGTNRDDWDCDRLARLGSTRINKGIEKLEEIALFSSHPNKANPEPKMEKGGRRLPICRESGDEDGDQRDQRCDSDC